MAKTLVTVQVTLRKQYTKEFDLPEDAAEQAADWEDPRQDPSWEEVDTYYMDEPTFEVIEVEPLEVDEE